MADQAHQPPSNPPTEQPGESVPEEPGDDSGTRLFRISEDDLEFLERALPEICEMATFAHAPISVDGDMARTPVRLRVQIRKLKEIISNVRWNYQPHSEVGIITDDEP